MAIDNQFGKGIGLAAGFDLGAQKPLDSRLAVNTIAERDAHVTENRAFEGMIVFVDETKKNYQLINGEWVELLKDEQDRLAALETQLNGGEGVEGNGVLANLQDAIDDVNARLDSNGDIDNRIAQNASDINALEQDLANEIGVPSVPADENGEGAVQATGMHKVVEDSAAELRGEILEAIGSADSAVAGEKSRAEGQEALIRQEFAAADSKLKSDLQKEIDDDVAAESALRVAEEARIEGKVDQEVIDRKAAVKEVADDLGQEIQDRKDAVQGVQDQIDAINDAEDGILAQAKALDKVDRDAQLLVDQEQDRRLKALEDANEEGGAVKEAIDQVAQDLADFEEAQGQKNNALDQKDGELNQAIVNEAAKAREEEGKLSQAIADEIADREEADGVLQKAIEDEASRAAGEEAAIRGEMATEASRVDQKIADDIAAAVALRVAEEQRIEKALEDAIDKEVEDRNAAIKVETDRAVAKEGELLAAINKEVQDRESAVSGEATARQQADTALDNRLKVVEASIGDGGDLEKRVEANEEAIKVINGEGEGSIKKAVADLVDGAPEALDTLNELAAALRDNANVLDAVEQAFDGKLATLQADVDQNEADCDAAIKAEKEAREAKEAEVAQAMATEQARVNKKISDDIAAESALRVAEEQRIEAKLDKAKSDLQKEIDDDVAAEAALRVAEEAKIRQELANEKKALQDEIDADVKVVADELANQKNAELEGSLANQIKVEKERAIAKENEIAGNLAQELLDRDAADDALDGRLQAVEASLGMGEGAGQEGIASRVENLEEAIGKAAVPGSDENPDGEQATGLHKVIDDKIAVLNGEVNDALAGLDANVAAEKERAEKEEARIAGLVSAEQTRAEKAEKALSDRLDIHLTTVAYDGDKEYTDLAVLGGENA